MRTQLFKTLAVVLVLTVAGAGLPMGTAAAEPTVRMKPPKPQVTKGVGGSEFKPGRSNRPVTPEYRPGPARLPRASARQTVTLPQSKDQRVAVQGTVVTLGAARMAGARTNSLREMTVQVLGAGARERAAVQGVLVRLDRPGQPPASSQADRAVNPEPGLEDASIPVTVDYSEFAGAFGGDWASRLQLFTVPECALAEEPKERAACGDTVPLDTTRDAKGQTVTADVPMAPDGASTYVVAQAAASGDQGDFKATPFAASSAWSVGLQTGNFSWSYSIPTVPVPGDLVPNLAVNYSAQSVDGRTQASNNQTSSLGEGHDLATGFIERNYASCADVTRGPAYENAKADLCWKTDNAVLSFGGQSSELLYNAATQQWRAKNDEGWRIRRIDSTPNDESSGDYWELTDQDGTRYYFGREKRYADDAVSTKSAWRVPVFGGSGEGCSDADGCDRAWRWNLDYVVDVHANTMSYFYQPETNKYGANNNTSQPSYVRGGYLTRIDYGQVAGAEHKTLPAAKVLFETEERCKPTAEFDCDPTKLNATNAEHWPDVPFDQICDDQQSCSDSKSPTFFTRKRLTKIRTQVRSGSGFADVDRIVFDQKFVPSGDGTGASLWLDAITRTGLDGGSKPLPPIEFTGKQLANRVLTDGAAPLNRWRVAAVATETGGRISVTYSGADCAPGAMPAGPASNRRRCFPVFWQQNEFQDPSLNWFHKYVVTQVKQSAAWDPSAPIVTTPVVTTYDYSDDLSKSDHGGAWHYDDNPLVKQKYRTWGEWRGYKSVEVRTGDATELNTTPSYDKYTYLRGMHADRLPDGPDADNNPDERSVTVTNDDGGSITDYNRSGGFLFEHVSRNGPGGVVTSAEVHWPWLSAVTAGTDSNPARILRTGSTHTRKQIVGTSTFIRTTSKSDFDDYGLPIWMHDGGDNAKDDSVCTHLDYARDSDKWLLSPVKRSKVVSVPCESTAGSANLVSEQRYYFDQQPHGGVLQGDVTKVETNSGTQANATWKTTAQSQYDARGRITSATDGMGHTTSTTYVPAAGSPEGGPLVRSVVTGAKGFTSAMDYAPGRGLPTKIIDTNDKVTAVDHDALGRLVSVWYPGRVRGTDTPDVKFGYAVYNDRPSHQSMSTLTPSLNDYNTSYEIFDGWLRPVETQQPSADLGQTGKVVSTTMYNSRGLAIKELGPYLVVNSNPSGTYWDPTETDVLDNHRFVYDGAGRLTADIYQPKVAEKWRTTTSYDANKVKVDPPTGGTPTTEITDVRGRVTTHVDHLGESATATGLWTRYTYDPAGRMATMTDPQANVWTWGYDLRGNQISATDPDKGEATMVYNNADQLVTTTDARGTSLHTTYDALGRKTGLYDGTTADSAKKRAAWTYDALAKGELGTTTRFSKPGDTSTAYTTTVDGYTDDYQPTAITQTIPSIDGETVTDAGASLAGSYTTKYWYLRDGTLQKKKFALAPGLPDEVVYDDFDRLGQSIGMGGFDGLVSKTDYSPFGDLIQLYTGHTAGYHNIHSWFYDEGTRRLSQNIVSNENAGHYISNLSYGYDGAGNVLRIADTGGTANDIQCFDYDYQRQLTEAWTISTGSCGAPSLTALGGVTPYWSTYTYDKIGNRKSETERTRSGGVVTTKTNDYTYPASGGAASPSGGVGGPHAVSSVVNKVGATTTTTAYKYDAAGNMANRGSQTLTWDSEGELATDDTGSGVAANVYDADGNRLIRKDPDGALTLYLDGQEIKAAGSAKTAQRWYEFAGEVIATRTGFAEVDMSLLAADHHGTGQVQVNSWTGEYTKRRFDPFGAMRGGINTAGWKGDHGFLDKSVDDTGLVQVGARYYDRSLGRFISVDPLLIVDDPRQANAYQYAGNNPATISDPTGLGYDDGGYCPPSSCGTSPDNDGGDPAGDNGGSEGGHPLTSGHPASSGGGTVAVPVARAAPAYTLNKVGSGLRLDNNALPNGFGFLTGPPRIGSRPKDNGGKSSNIVGRPDKTGPAAARAEYLAEVSRKLRALTEQKNARIARWRVGDSIYQPTSRGRAPKWSTVRARFWKNEANRPQIEKWSPGNLVRMARGLAPRRYNRDKRGMESMELSHEPIPYRDGGTAVVPRWPQDHAAVDPFRRPGY